MTRAPAELYEELLEKDGNSPLQQMTLTERVDADFRGTGLTIGKHPVAYHRGELKKLKALRAIDIRKLRNGTFVRVAGWVIVRQRPGTAKGFMFLSLEDETGVSNIIVTPQLFDQYRLELVGHPFLLIEGALQNQDNVISVKASHVQPLSLHSRSRTLTRLSLATKRHKKHKTVLEKTQVQKNSQFVLCFLCLFVALSGAGGWREGDSIRP